MKTRLWILFWLFYQLSSGNDMTGSKTIASARIQSATDVEIVFTGQAPVLSRADVSVVPGVTILEMTREGRVLRLKTSSLDVRQNYRIHVKGSEEKELLPDGILDAFVTDKPLGCSIENGARVFRLFAPRATRVRLELFDRCDAPFGTLLEMRRDDSGTWELIPPHEVQGSWYGYRISGPAGENEMFNPDLTIADPYSPAMATRNHYLHQGRTWIPDGPAFEWEGDAGLSPELEDLVIYEMHVRDMTANPNSGLDAARRGTYLGLVEGGKPGGIDYIASLGVNAVELLPVQEFGNIEIDYQNPMLRLYNNWNPYARNHWGYMTTGFFAPESYYASDGSVAPGGWSGSRGSGIRELKEAVKRLHRRGIAVIMDVVYNHVSNYDLNPFKYIDKKYYFRLDDDGQFLSASGCGNDFRTERPMARRLIVESLLYWMKEYHVDGFRFDLATMIDGGTLDAVTRETRRLNPKVILIAEPWGGGRYGQEEFSRRGWAAWNDMFRNGVKGQNPRDGLGFIFGKWQGGNSQETLRHFVTGTLRETGGPFYRSAHSVNYLESHDDETLGDFVRIGTGEVKEEGIIADVEANAKLSAKQLAVHKLAALFLFTSRGPVMIHAGQEFGRGKVIAPTDSPEPRVGRIDRNSYNKDDETNWINYRHAGMNRDLVEYYRGLIEMRRMHSAFRRGLPESVRFLQTQSPLALGYLLKSEKRGEPEIVVILNGDPDSAAAVRLPEGEWSPIVDGARAGTGKIGPGSSGEVTVPACSGTVLMGETR
jgi:pullulanase